MNQSLFNNRKALFQTYNGSAIPYVHNFFDRVMTVNTIYFWEKHKDFLTELYRVLKPSGTCIITFVNVEFMQNLPFVDTSFHLFNVSRMKELMRKTPFESANFQNRSEQVLRKSGEPVTRDYVVAILKKEPH